MRLTYEGTAADHYILLYYIVTVPPYGGGGLCTINHNAGAWYTAGGGCLFMYIYPAVVYAYAPYVQGTQWIGLPCEGM